MTRADYDIFVIGGGVNGCGIARDAAGRGYSVALAEMSDLASGTSSWSTKLVHGGLRYLEHYEFRLVREALIEREVLWAAAPHIIRPLRFVLPHHKGLRPAWLLRLGLFIYDHLGGRKRLPPTRTLDLARDPAGEPLRREFAKGFEYSDCWVDDARLVVLSARDAAARGARIRTRTRVVSARREDGIWQIREKDGASGLEAELTARLLVNASGPWVDHVLGGALGRNAPRNVRLVQGSHIVVPKVYEHDRAYIFQHSDDRIVFAIPYERDFTLIGTTDRDFEGDPGEVRISSGEIDYLCTAVGEYFARPISRDDVVWTYSGVRPLFDDGASKAQEATRDYVLKVDDTDARARLVNIFGGKITTYRKLSEAVLEKVEEALGRRGAPWTANARLPGGDFDVDEFDDLVDRIAREYPFVQDGQAARLAHAYGTEVFEMLGDARTAEDLGEDFGAGLTAREVDWQVDREWARSAEDVLWRRTKLGLRTDARQVSRLSAYLEGSRADATRTAVRG